MARFLIAAFHYLAAGLFIWAGAQSFPLDSVGWPQTDAEVIGAWLVTIGMGSKLLGHVWLLSLSRATAR